MPMDRFIKEPLSPFVEFQRPSELEKKEILKWIKRNCSFFANVYLPEFIDISIIKTNTRIPLINRYDVAMHIFVLLKGNMFELIGKDLPQEKLEAIPSGTKIAEVFCPGDIMTDFSNCLVAIKPQVIHDFINVNYIAGLPWERVISPVELVGIRISDFYYSKSQQRLSEKLDRLNGAFKKKERQDSIDVYSHIPTILANEEQMYFYLTSISELLYEKLLWNKMQLCAQMKNKGVSKIASVLYQCFYGKIPLRWWVNFHGEEIGNKEIRRLRVLRKPELPITSFILQKIEIAALMGISTKRIKSIIVSLKGNSDLSKYLDIKELSDVKDLKKEMQGTYEFSIKIPEGIKTRADIRKLCKEFGDFKSISMFTRSDCKEDLPLDRLIFEYVMYLLEKYFVN